MARSRHIQVLLIMVLLVLGKGKGFAESEPKVKLQCYCSDVSVESSTPSCSKSRIVNCTYEQDICISGKVIMGQSRRMGVVKSCHNEGGLEELKKAFQFQDFYSCKTNLCNKADTPVGGGGKGGASIGIGMSNVNVRLLATTTFLYGFVWSNVMVMVTAVTHSVVRTDTRHVHV